MRLGARSPAKKSFGIASITTLAGIVATLGFSACATLMGVSEPVLAEAEGGGGSGDGASGGIDGQQGPADVGDPDACSGFACPCKLDRDCRDTAAFGKCDGEKCVACLTDDHCGANNYCLPGHTCAPGCRSDPECLKLSPSAPYCDPTRHQCIQCKSKADCTPLGAALECSPAGYCATKCALAPDSGLPPCPTGQLCCGTPSLCVDVKSDVFNCNACGKQCVGATTLCCAGACTDTSNTATSCGSCAASCLVSVKNGNQIGCANSRCTFKCNNGFTNCDSNSTNGCECVCGATNQPCCGGTPGSGCQGTDYCGTDALCHTCVKKDGSCTATTDCCNQSGKGCEKGKCDK